MSLDAAALFYEASLWVVPILVAITLHEAGHAYAAWLCGDPTAKSQGRVSLNPIRHIDRFGTIMLPAMLWMSGTGFVFGWAKPVPVDLSNCRHPRRDNFLISFAGPGMNLVLAYLALLAAHLAFFVPGAAGEWLDEMLFIAAFMNVILFILNLLPVMPLDGGHIVSSLLPDSLATPFRTYNGDGLAILATLFILVPLVTRSVGHEIDPAHWLVVDPTLAVVSLLEVLAFH